MKKLKKSRSDVLIRRNKLVNKWKSLNRARLKMQILFANKIIKAFLSAKSRNTIGKMNSSCQNMLAAFNFTH